MNKKRVVMIALALILVVACFVYPRKVVLNLGIFAGSNWDVPNGESYQIIDDAIARFEKKYPQVTIEYDSGILKEDYSSWLSNQILQGDEPDVYMVLSEDFNTLSSLGALENLDGFIDDEGLDMSRYYSSTLASGKLNNHQYALPYESNPTLMFVNKTLLENNGIALPDNQWTLDDFYTICQQVTNVSHQYYGCYNYQWLDCIYGYGVSLFDESGTNCYLYQDQVKEALSFIQKLNDLNQGHTVTSQEFDMGQVAFAPMTFAQYRTYKPYPWRVKKYTNFEWDCVKMPSVNSQIQSGQVSSLMMGLSSRSDHKQLAFSFLSSLTYDYQSQEDLFRYSQGISSLKDVTQSKEALALLDQETVDSQVDMSLLNEVMENSVSHSHFKKYDASLSLLDSRIKDILLADGDIDTALIALQKEMNQYLNE